MEPQSTTEDHLAYVINQMNLPSQPKDGVELAQVDKSERQSLKGITKQHLQDIHQRQPKTLCSSNTDIYANFSRWF